MKFNVPKIYIYFLVLPIVYSFTCSASDLYAGFMEERKIQAQYAFEDQELQGLVAEITDLLISGEQDLIFYLYNLAYNKKTTLSFKSLLSNAQQRREFLQRHARFIK